MVRWLSHVSYSAVALAIAVSSFGPTAAHAQAPSSAESAQGEASPQGATQANPAADDQNEEIIVQAQRRQESAQSVPISLQSFSADTLQRVGVRNTEDLTNAVGGLMVQPSAGRPALFVRGVGNNSSHTTPSVLTFVDGIYYPFGGSIDFANVASVDVLKGPQGTLFGRNATGGVIQIATRAPSDTFSAQGELGYGNYETVDASGYVTGPVGNGVAIDAAFRFRHQSDGFGTNVNNGEDVFFTNRFGLRSRIRANLGEVVTLTVGGDYARTRGSAGTNVSPAFGYGVLFVGGALRSRGPGQYWPGNYDINAGPVQPGYRSHEWGVNGTLEAALDGVTLRSITSFRQNGEHIFIDFDGTPANALLFTLNRTPRRVFTQELQAVSSGSGPFQWVVGAFYYFNHSRSADFQLATMNARATDRDRSGAIYAQGTYQITPTTRLTLGGRYTIEKRRIEGLVLLNGVEAAGRTGSDSLTFNEFTWRVALDQYVTPNVMVYASASRGFNAGFFSSGSFAGFANRTQNPPVLPEYLNAYEVGFKSDLFDRHLRVNMSVFRYDYSNLQQQIYDQGVVKTINAASARIQGLEFEIVARPVSGLTLSLTGTYLDPEYTSYPQAPNYVRQANGSITAIGNIDAAGNSIVNAPELSYTATASYVLPTSIGRFTTTANLYYRGDTFADPTNRYPLTNPHVLNLSERWDLPNGNLYFSIWAKNLTNAHYDYAVNILTPAGLVGNPAPPRTYGATIGFDF